ncbi:amidase [Sandarakinorhabdus sp. AAP62]|uniref:amidase n=1 Tax=Sandarakinorhabdus sp. AAP62 TaxID=1248916 RepID=UPI00052564BD|nr:amidase [Sandarakinorhabdus sp. AAP62]
MAQAGALALAPAAVAQPRKPLDPLLAMPGRHLAALIAARKASAEEVMRAVLAQIGAHNPAHNAIVALQDGDQLLAQARAMDARLGAGETPGPLFGLPWAVKDLAEVIGIRSTGGSLVNKDRIPTCEGIMVQRLRRAGAIFIGKTNAPEFGFGSHTINRVYGPTRNSFDPSKSAGGSSGGAGVGLALRMLPLADGSDFGGSLRNPAAWNNVFGFRTGTGVIPPEGNEQWIGRMGVPGPMARHVADLGLVLSVMAGKHPQSLQSINVDARAFAGPLDADLKGVRIGWLGDWGGRVPHEPEVLRICEAALPAFRSIGCTVDVAQVDHEIEPVWQALLVLRSWMSGTGLQRLADDPATRDLIGSQAHWEIANSRTITGAQVLNASAVRSAWTRAVDRLFERHDFLIAPAVQLLPFPVAQNWPTEVAGKRMRTYHEWMLGTFLVTMTGLPALAAPAGFSADGLPAGIQIIGRRGAELACLKLAHAYEQAASAVVRQRPPGLAA